MSKQVDRSDMDKLPKIVAIDFDGVLVSDKFPEIGDIDLKMFDVCQQLKACGIKLILWTSRDNNTEDRHLDAAVTYCKQHGLIFDAVNDNILEVQTLFQNNTRKVYADLYIDDKAVPHLLTPAAWAPRLGLHYTRTNGITV